MAGNAKVRAVPAEALAFDGTTSLGLPDRKKIIATLDRAMESVIFEVQHYLAEESTNLTAYFGGMKRWAGEVAMLFEDASVLATMRESLTEKE